MAHYLSTHRDSHTSASTKRMNNLHTVTLAQHVIHMQSAWHNLTVNLHRNTTLTESLLSKQTRN